MGRLKALRNTTNRPLELVFGEQSERIASGKVGKFHTESDWKGSFAEKQADEFIKRHEAKYVYDDQDKVEKSQMFEQKSALVQAAEINVDTAKNSKKKN